MPGKAKAVFFDRDGTLIEDRDYLDTPEGVELLPSAAEAIRALRSAGYRAVVVTNQSGIARGMLDEVTLEAIHRRMRDVLRAEGADVDAVYYCPHLPEAPLAEYAGPCECRKPAPGMLLAAAADLDLDLRGSWMIGDAERDILAGKAAGCRTILLRHRGSEEFGADFAVASLAEAVEIILKHG